MSHERPIHIPPPRPISVKLEGPIRIDIHVYHHAVPGKDDAAMRALTKTLTGGTDALADAVEAATPPDPQPPSDGQPT